jgi:hypothetical protein
MTGDLCTFWHKHFKDCINGYCYYEVNPGITCPKKEQQILNSAPNYTAQIRNQLEAKGKERTGTPSTGEFKTYGKY